MKKEDSPQDKEDKKIENENISLKNELEHYKFLSKQYEMILDHLPALIFYKDTKNNFIHVNKYVADAHNLSKTDLEGKSLYEIYPKDVAEKYFQDDLEVIKSGVSKLNIEEPWDTAKGRRWVNTSKILYLDEDNTCLGIIGVSVDITEKKKFEDELKKKNEELSAANSEKEKFLAIIAHDLRNPIANCLNITNLLVEEMSNLNQNEKDALLINLNVSAKRINRLLENLLEWAMLKQGKMTFTPKQSIFKL